MTKKQKAKDVLNKILKSKNFNDISRMREELDYYLDAIEEDKVAAWLRKQDKEQKSEAYTPIELKSVY